MTRFSLVVLFSMACPATLLAQTALQIKKPPMPGTTTSNINTAKTSSATTSVAQPLLNNAKRNTLDQQYRSIQQGMSEANERQDKAMSAASTTQARSTGQKTLDMQRQMRPCPTC